MVPFILIDPGKLFVLLYQTSENWPASGIKMKEQA